jgi:hypothetical protein
MKASHSSALMCVGLGMVALAGSGVVFVAAAALSGAGHGTGLPFYAFVGSPPIGPIACTGAATLAGLPVRWWKWCLAGMCVCIALHIRAMSAVLSQAKWAEYFHIWDSSTLMIGVFVLTASVLCLWLFGPVVLVVRLRHRPR